jgi:hypothetical protein
LQKKLTARIVARLLKSEDEAEKQVVYKILTLDRSVLRPSDKQQSGEFPRKARQQVLEILHGGHEEDTEYAQDRETLLSFLTVQMWLSSKVFQDELNKPSTVGYTHTNVPIQPSSKRFCTEAARLVPAFAAAIGMIYLIFMPFGLDVNLSKATGSALVHVLGDHEAKQCSFKEWEQVTKNYYFLSWADWHPRSGYAYDPQCARVVEIEMPPHQENSHTPANPLELGAHFRLVNATQGHSHADFNHDRYENDFMFNWSSIELATSEAGSQHNWLHDLPLQNFSSFSAMHRVGGLHFWQVAHAFTWKMEKRDPRVPSDCLGPRDRIAVCTRKITEGGVSFDQHTVVIANIA